MKMLRTLTIDDLLLYAACLLVAGLLAGCNQASDLRVQGTIPVSDARIELN